MRHPAGRVMGSGLLWQQKLAQPHLLVPLLASMALHAVFLSQLTRGPRFAPAPESQPPVLVAHLWLPTSPLTPPPTPAPTPAERSGVAKSGAKPGALSGTMSGAHRTIVRQPVNPTDVPTATAADTANPQPAEPTPAAPVGPQTNRPLDLSPQVMRQAVRRNTTPNLAQAAREQVGHEPTTAAARLGQHIASGAVPDCLHNAPDGEGKASPVAVGGLFALPFVAYAAMTGKCK